MNDGLRYALGSLGALSALFGAFVLLRARHRETAREPWLRSPARRSAWGLLLAGGAVAAGALLLP